MSFADYLFNVIAIVMILMILLAMGETYVKRRNGSRNATGRTYSVCDFYGCDGRSR